MRIRIIPARAGFTRDCRRRCCRRPDHPRSRGVYRCRGRRRRRDWGSSPLARGLPRSASTPPPRRRIIPARAGFTRRRPPARRPPRDHPRSRGVYTRQSPGGPGETGSSPLARGLPAVASLLSDPARIIPARAGFTRAALPSRPPAWDHPRSRGVYVAERAAHWAGPGSSPLARGLPVHDAQDSQFGRIIPARAGFTRFSTIRPPLRLDHPRSRGVYRSVDGGDTWEERIIPARAGFTKTPLSGMRRLADHPRSRGVYSTYGAPTGFPSGSSPLARGLPGDGLVVDDLDGIIPARAGFTDSVGAPHGVPRIIPARAGFTGPRRGRWVRWRDHPRSRGVYAR